MIFSKLNFLLAVASVFYVVQPPSVAFGQVTEYNSQVQENDRAISVLYSNDGNIVVVGEYSNSSGKDIYFAKLTPQGAVLSAKRFDAGQNETPSSMIKTSDGGYLIAGTTFNLSQSNDKILLIKVDSDGNMQWSKFIGDAFNRTVLSSFEHDVYQLVSGDFVITGYYQDGCTNVLCRNLLVAKISAAGNLLWLKTYDLTQKSDWGNGIVEDSDGNLVVVGASDGPYLDCMLVKMNADGDILWNRKWGGNHHDGYSNIVINSAGNYFISGHARSFSSGGNADLITALYSPTGDLLWNKIYGGSGDELNGHIRAAGGGGYWLATYTSSVGAGSSDGYVAKFDENGNQIWAGTFGNAGDDRFFAFDVSGDRILAAGYTTSFGPTGENSYLASVNLNETDGCHFTENYLPLVAENVFNSQSSPFTLITPNLDATGTVTVSDFNISWNSPCACVPPTATITGPGGVCLGASATFSAATSGATGMQWDADGDGVFEGSGDSHSFAYSAPGNYVARFWASNGNCEEIYVHSVIVYPLPTANAGPDKTICPGTSTTLTGAGGGAYSWQPATGLSNPGVFNPVASPAQTTTYTLTVTDANGCTDTDEATITVTPGPTANAGPDKTICPGTSTTLTGSGGGAYSWQPATGLSNPGIHNPVASPAQTTTYTLTVTDANGCADTDEVAVTIFYADAGTDAEVCLGASTRLRGSPGAGHSWSPADGLSDPAVADPVASPAQTTTYTLFVAHADGGCSATDEVTVTVHPLPTANAGPDVSLCVGNSVTLRGSGGTSFRWEPATNLSNPAVAAPVASPAQSTTYTLTVTDANGCTDTDETTITVTPLPTADAGPDVFLCKGNGAYLSGSGGTQYRWEPAAGLSNASVATPFAAPNASTVYTLTVTDANGCADTDEVRVFVHRADAGADAEVCRGGSVRLEGSGGTEYRWQPVFGLSDPAVPDPVATPAHTTIYTLTVTDANGCTDSDAVEVRVLPRPSGEIVLPDTFFQGEPLALRAYVSNDAVSFRWETGEEFFCRPNCVIVYDSLILDTVRLIVDNGRCLDTVYKVIYLIPAHLALPNVFTPNGDGLNDEFYPIHDGMRSVKWEVYDRWGILVFRGDERSRWNGTFLGRPCPEGVYVGTIRVESRVGRRVSRTFSITLIR